MTAPASMDTFQELDLGPEVVEALAAEGIEIPTPFQEDALPVIRRGNNLVGRTGPGAGTLVAYGAALLDRLEPGQPGPRAVILAPTRERADGLCRSLSRLVRFTGHRVAALGGTWALAESAEILFAAPGDLLAAVRGSRVKLDGVEALVVDGAATIHSLGDFETVETLAGLVPSDAQRVVLSLPLPDAVKDFVDGHVKRAVHVPAKSAVENGEEIPRRGRLRYLVPDADREEAALTAVARLLEEDGTRHVAVFFPSDDEAADVGDRLTLHGYAAGEPGDESVPVWLGVDNREVQSVLLDLDDPSTVATLGYRVPAGPDSLDRRHGRGGTAMTLALGRELPHLRQAAAIAGYELVASPSASPPGLTEELDRLRDRLLQTMEEEDLAPYFLLVEPLTERHSSAEIAAAAVALLRRGAATEGAAPPAGARPGASEEGDAARPWVRLFISLGSKDAAGPGDILGAITGEAGVDGDRVGRIDIKDTFSLVEIDERVARDVIRSMNGITVKGRSIRVDYDRKGARGGGSRGGR